MGRIASRWPVTSPCAAQCRGVHDGIVAWDLLLHGCGVRYSSASGRSSPVSSAKRTMSRRFARPSFDLARAM